MAACFHSSWVDTPEWHCWLHQVQSFESLLDYFPKQLHLFFIPTLCQVSKVPFLEPLAHPHSLIEFSPPLTELAGQDYHPIFQMRKLRLRLVKLLAQVTQTVSQDSNHLPSLEPYCQGADVREAEGNNGDCGDSGTKGTLPHS